MMSITIYCFLNEMMIILGSKGAKQFKIFFSFFFLMNMWYVSLHREKISRYNICINCFFFSVHSKIHYLNCHQTRNTIKRFFILKLQIYIYIYKLIYVEIRLHFYYTFLSVLPSYLFTRKSLENKHFSISLYYHKKWMAITNPLYTTYKRLHFNNDKVSSLVFHVFPW